MGMNNHVELPSYACLRCGHTWIPRRADKPRRCPKCKTPYWDTPNVRKVTIAGVEDQWLENAKEWLQRAGKDFAAFKKLVPFNKQNYRNIQSSDPALAVYLLQQSVEKAVKAVAITSGQYSGASIKKSFSHNSFDLLLDFQSRVLSQTRDLGLDDIYKLLSGIGTIQAEEKISNARRASQVNELARSSPDVVESLLRVAESIRKDAILKTLKEIFGPHSKIRTQEQNKKDETVQDTVEIFDRIWTRNLGQPDLTASELDLVATITDKLAKLSPLRDGDKKMPGFITVERNTETWLGIWSLVSLIILACLTFPHESSSRYPGLPQSIEGAIGVKKLNCGDYNQDLGIVKNLGYFGRVTELVLNDMSEMLDAVGFFFGVRTT